MTERFRSIDGFLALLQGVEPVGTDAWKALCPNHADRDPSLTIKLKDNKIVIHDFGGCDTPDIVNTLGLKMRHLFLDDGSKPDKARGRPRKGTGPREPVAEYIYTDADGKRLFRKLRYDPKDFDQQRAEGAGGWVGGPGCLNGVERVLWALPQVIAADTVYWCEGEKDAINMATKLGVVATTCVEGAPMKPSAWKQSYATAVKGKNVVLVPDRDKAGISHALFIVGKLDGIAASVKVLLLPTGYKDISDWLAVNGTAEWEEMLLTARDYTTESATELTAMYGEPVKAPPGAGGDGKVAVRDMVLPTRDTDIGNAERLVRLHGDVIRYCYERKSWYIWNGKLWEIDLGAKINALAKGTVLNIYREAADEPDDGRRKALVDHARKSESDQRIRAMLSRAESEAGIPVSVTEMDADPWLLNCQNGILDLTTGRLLRHDPAKLMTHIVATEYSPEAPCLLWRDFMTWVTAGNDDLEAYIQRALGYSLIGDVSEQVLFFCYGLGSNGKTTLTSTFHTMMGDYAGKLQAEDLMVQERRIGGRPTEGLANLFGKRYALGSEVRDGKRLDVGLIKDMTGGEVINARHLYEREFKYRPTCTLWLYGNKKPAIHDTSLAVWRRVKLLPFTQTIADKDRDRNLEAKMERDELPGILAWAVLGVLEWQARGLIDPEAVTVATQSYREAEDVLGEWIAECCYLDDPLASILKADLQRNYASWCQDNIHAEVKRSTFKSSLEERGVTSFRGTGNKHYWKGIRLLNDDDIKAREEAAAVAKAQKVTKVTKVTTSPAAQPELPNTADEGGVTEVTGVTDSPPKSLHEKNIESLDGIKVRKVTKVTGSTATVSFTCGNCKGRRYWLRGGTAKLCAACHPPPIEDTPISGSL